MRPSAQIEEAQLLAPGDPLVVTMKGWLMAERGEWKLALASLDRAMEMAPDQRLASLLRIKVLKHWAPPVKKRVRQVQQRRQGGRRVVGSRSEGCPVVGLPPPQNGLRPRQNLAIFPEGNAATTGGKRGQCRDAETRNTETLTHRPRT